MEFAWNFQESNKFEQGALFCTWITDQFIKRNLEFQICDFFNLLLEFDSNFDFGYLELD
jgi:hypothetical protein